MNWENRVQTCGTSAASRLGWLSKPRGLRAASEGSRPGRQFGGLPLARDSCAASNTSPMGAPPSDPTPESPRRPTRTESPELSAAGSPQHRVSEVRSRQANASSCSDRPRVPIQSDANQRRLFQELYGRYLQRYLPS